jgi:hypothetical protein
MERAIYTPKFLFEEFHQKFNSKSIKKRIIPVPQDHRSAIVLFIKILISSFAKFNLLLFPEYE